MALRNAGPQPFASWSPSAQARHVGRRSRLVDEDEPLWVEVELALEPGLAPLQNIRPILLRRMGGLFLTVRPQRSRKVQIVPIEADMPCWRRRSCISARVMSGVSAIKPSKNSR